MLLEPKLVKQRESPTPRLHQDYDGHIQIDAPPFALMCGGIVWSSTGLFLTNGRRPTRSIEASQTTWTFSSIQRHVQHN
jgi:hypothetical protein